MSHTMSSKRVSMDQRLNSPFATSRTSTEFESVPQHQAATLSRQCQMVELAQRGCHHADKRFPSRNRFSRAGQPFGSPSLKHLMTIAILSPCASEMRNSGNHIAHARSKRNLPGTTRGLSRTYSTPWHHSRVARLSLHPSRRRSTARNTRLRAPRAASETVLPPGRGLARPDAVGRCTGYRPFTSYTRASPSSGCHRHLDHDLPLPQ